MKYTLRYCCIQHRSHSPRFFNEKFLGNNLLGVAHENLHDLIFFQAQLDLFLSIAEGIILRVQPQVMELQAVNGNFSGTASQGTNSGEQFTGDKWLCQVVVCTAVQTVNFIGNV